MASTKTDSGASYKLRKAMESMGLPGTTKEQALWGKKPLKHQAPITTYPEMVGMEVPNTPKVKTQRHVGDRLSGDFTWDAPPPPYPAKELSPGGKIVKAMNADSDLVWDAEGCPDPQGRFYPNNHPIKEGNPHRGIDITGFQDRRDAQPHFKRHGVYRVESLASKAPTGRYIEVGERSGPVTGPVKTTFKKVKRGKDENPDIEIGDWYQSEEG